MAKQKINSAQQLNTVLTQTNAGNVGGTMNYIDLGGIKILWMKTNSIAISASTVYSGYTIIPPTGFFTSTPKVVMNVATADNNLCTVRGYAETSSLFTFTGHNTSGGTGNITVDVIAIGV